MLSVVPIKQSSISSSYYLKQDGGYYIEDEKNKDLYQWFGKGANELGLNGTINNRDHTQVYSGRLPNGEIVGKQMPDGSIKGRPGYDLTFSMNKDLSLIICASNDKNLSNYFLNAHINAVKTTLTEVEKRIEARTTADGFTGFETTKNMIASLCTHFSSRAGDPDVHTHSLIANATKRSDGKWRALATDMSRKNGFFEMIRDNATYFGALYQNEMAIATKNRGFDIESIHKNGMFKISGFPDDLRDCFSKRRKQIEEIVSTLNPAAQDNKKTYDKVAQHSKASKESIDQQSFYEKARRDVETYLEENHDSKNFDEIVCQCMENKKTLNTDTLKFDTVATNAIQEAITDLSKFNVYFNKNKIAHRAMTLHLGEITNQALESAFQREIISGNLIPIKNNEYTTTALIARENNLLQSVNAAAINLPTLNTENDKQNHFNNLFHKNRFCLITEPNSIKEKNKFLSDLITTFENQDKKIKVLTIDKGMNQDLNNKNNQATGIFERLKNITKGDIAVNIHAFLKQYESEINVPLNNIFTKDGKEVFIVDDAKRLDFNTIQKLIDLTEKRKAHIVFLKNHNGRHSILAGNPIELIEKCDIEKIDARKHYSHSKNADVEKSSLSNKITITEVPKSDTPQSSLSKQSLRHKTLAQLFTSQDSDQIAVSHSKKNAELLNIAIRDELKDKGKIGQQQYVIKTLNAVFLNDSEKKQAQYYPKDALLKTYLGHGVFRTQKILGHDVTQNKIILQSEFGRRSLIDPSKIIKDISRNIAGIYEEKNIALAEGDRICIAHENKILRQLNLESNKSYKISEINEKHVTLHNTVSNKIIKTKLGNLSNLSINYHYAISAQGSLASLKSKQPVLCDFPAYAVNANTLSDIGRHTEKIHVVTDDAEITRNRVDKFIAKEIAIDHGAVNSTSNKAVIQKIAQPENKSISIEIER